MNMNFVRTIWRPGQKRKLKVERMYHNYIHVYDLCVSERTATSPDRGHVVERALKIKYTYYSHTHSLTTYFPTYSYLVT